MDRKTLAIVVLTITATLLAGVVVQGLREKPAYAQSGRFADFAMVPVAYATNSEALCVVDTTTQRMLFFKYTLATKLLEVMSKADLRQDFGEKKP